MHPLKRANYPRLIETVLAGLGFLGMYVLLAYFAPGGITGTDVIGYVVVGMNGSKATGAFLNRYFHILLQRIFVQAAPTPLQGVQYYWAFLIASICLLIYLSARLFSPNSRPIHGVLAVGLFLSIAALADSAGSTDIDLTAMFIVLAIVTVYLLYLRSGLRSRWLIALLGVLFYLAFKTKETTLVSGLLVFGFGFDADEHFSFRRFFRNLLIFAGGCLIGLFVFALWTWLVVGDPLYGIRPSEYLGYLTSYATAFPSGGAQNGIADWLSGFFFSSLLVITLLYILSGIKGSGFSLPRRLVWLYPLALILFLSLSIGNRYGFSPRFAYPALPVLCLLGVQLLRFDPPANRAAWREAAIWTAAGLVMVVLCRLALKYVVPKIGWDSLEFYYVVFAPLLIMGILAIGFLVSQVGMKTSILLSLLILSLLITPLTRNFKVTVLTHPNQVNAAPVYYPFQSFSDEIHFTPAMRMFIADDVWVVMGNPWSTKNIDEVVDVFDVSFRANAQRSNITFSGLKSDNLDAVLDQSYTYLLFSQTDWDLFAADPAALAQVQQHYRVFHDPQNLLVFLQLH